MTDENIRMIYDMSAERIRETDTAFYRYLYSQIDWDSRVVALDGPRGVGKTTMFLQHLKESADGSESALYISVDNVWLNAQELYELVQHHVRHGGTSIYIDEIHYLKDWRIGRTWSRACMITSSRLRSHTPARRFFALRLGKPICPAVRSSIPSPGCRSGSFLPTRALQTCLSCRSARY